MHVALWFFDRWVEFDLYPRSFLLLGFLEGLIAMMIFSFIVCWLLIVFYDWVSTVDTAKIKLQWAKRLMVSLSDALGFETLKEIATDFRETLLDPPVIYPAISVAFIGAVLRRWIIVPVARVLIKLRLESLTLFLYTSLMHDPMTCLILMRPAHDHHMGLREWKIFLASVVVSCTGFGLFVKGVMLLLEGFTPELWNIIQNVLTRVP